MADQTLHSRSHFLTPSTSQINSQNFTTTEFVPTVKQSGYIVGAPIGYTNQPVLPTHLQPHTPKNLLTQIPATNTTSKVVTGTQFFPPHPPSNSNSRVHINYSPQKPITTTIREDTVPRYQYDRCVQECQAWKSRFDELYREHNYRKQSKQEFHHDNNLREENEQLKRKLKEWQSREQQMYENLQNRFMQLVDKYRESTTKECMLLTDRYRLQKKYEQRF